MRRHRSQSTRLTILKYSYFYFAIECSSDDTATTVFEQTPLISTYLIAFVVSDFPHRNRPGAKQRVYAQPSLNESTELGLEDGVRILEALERYLSVSYALPKMDQVAVPKFLPGGIKLIRVYFA